MDKQNGCLSEEDIQHNLDRIRERMDKNSALVFRYRFHALFPDLTKTICDNENFYLKDGYLLLRRHEEYYRFALSLILYMIDDGYGSKSELDQLTQHVSESRTYETDIRHQRLNLWRMLTNIASELTSEQNVRSLISSICEELAVNTENIVIDKSYSLASALNAFRWLEEKGRLKPMLEEHPPELRKGLYLHRLLAECNFNKLLSNYVEPFNPHQPLTLALLDVERLRSTDSTVNKKELSPLTAFNEYRCGILNAYNTMSIIEVNQWPPVKKHFYINLALITPEFIPRADSFSRATIRGSVDDIYKKKVPIDFDAVFPTKLASKRHYVGLIEGRPGCGKSTLITKVSKDWSEGKILRDVEVFILVRLRRFVGKTKVTLKDLLGMYSANPTVVDMVHDKITKEGGEGVCFAFDGLDEYSAHLTPNNLVMKIIYGHVLPLAAVFLTSRPATSEKFKQQTLLTKNIEIIGFFEEEIKMYVHASFKDVEGGEASLENGQSGEAKATALIKYISDHPNIQRMCYLPLHIAMVVYLYGLDASGSLLPKTETDLYYKFTLQTLYRASLKDLDEDADEDDIELHEFSDLPEKKYDTFRSVCQLAFMATAKQKQMFTGREIKKLTNLPEVPKKKDYDSVGLLTVDRMIADTSLPTKTFSFLHLTHQEFLAAVHLVDHLSDSEQFTAIKELTEKVHMWVVWKFFCGLHAKNAADRPEDRSDSYNRSFKCLIDDNIYSRLACLNMIHCAFESQFRPSCSDLLACLDGNVDVKDIALTPSDCSALGYVLAQAFNEVKEIDFSYCHLGHNGIAAFVQQLKDLDSFPKVDMLRLRARIDYKPVGIQGAYDLIELLGKLPNLGELRLYGNKLTSERFQYLAPAIGKLKMLHTLILSRNDLEVGTGSMVSGALENLSLLHTFYISYNPLTEVGLGDMKPGLLKCKELKILGLRGTSLGEGAGVHLGDILSTLTKLEVIELYQNRIGDKGVIDMAPGLMKAQSLLTLSLVENHISNSGALALTEYLSTTKTLKEIRIYYNHEMTDVGKIALRTAVVDRPSCLNYLGLAV